MTLDDKLNAARECIRQAFESARSPLLLWSSGKDSMLLLFLAREIQPDIPLLWYRGDLTHGQRLFAEKVIKEFDLTVYGYPPANAYLISNSAGLTLVREYDIGGQSLPVLLDIAQSENCKHVSTIKRLARFDYTWDVSLVGWKRTDSHPAISGVNLDGLPFGTTTFVSPLKDFSDEDVWSAIHQLGIAYDHARYERQSIEYDPDLLLVCADCLSRAGVGLLKAA